MAGRQDHAEVSVQGLGQIGDRGRGEHPEPQHVDPGTGQPGDDRGFEEFTGDTRIPAHDSTRAGGRAVRALRVPQAQLMRGRYGQIEGQLCRQITASDAPDTVSTEQTAHEVTLQVGEVPVYIQDAQRRCPEYQDSGHRRSER